MFSFPTKTKQPEVAVAPTTGKYSPEIEAIHHEFFTASDKLLAEANGILEEAAKINRGKIDRLLSLGFKQSREVEQTAPVFKKAELTKEQVELVKYYSQQYPLHKFITEEQVKGICQRWGLICGGVELFKGFIPEKNLKEIERFKLKGKEANTLIASNGLVFENAEIRNHGNYYHIYKKGSVGLHSYAFQSTDGISFYGTDGHDLFGYNNPPEGVRVAQTNPRHITTFTLSNSLQICAPIKDMDLTGMVVKNGYRVEKEIPDPVVLQPVRGGYIILTAWGPEASDPDVVNERMN